MHPTNPAQFDDAMADRVPVADEVRPGIWSIPLPMARPGNPFSLCYLIAGDDGSLHLIDTGYDGDENWRLFQDAVAGFGLSDVGFASVFGVDESPDEEPPESPPPSFFASPPFLPSPSRHFSNS